MLSPLRVGVAGLGTVGTSVLRRLDGQSGALRQRTGRDIVVTAVAARSRDKDRDLDLTPF